MDPCLPWNWDENANITGLKALQAGWLRREELKLMLILGVSGLAGMVEVIVGFGRSGEG